MNALWKCETTRDRGYLTKNLKFYSDKIFIKNNLFWNFFWHQQYEFEFISGQPEVTSESKFGYFQVFTHCTCIIWKIVISAH